MNIFDKIPLNLFWIFNSCDKLHNGDTVSKNICSISALQFLVIYGLTYTLIRYMCNELILADISVWLIYRSGSTRIVVEFEYIAKACLIQTKR